ncbi:hypothetical protein M378DRAFT_164246 [Amanita muscaria Koide BX008]|uniref:Uncharacterized protein n=1 Tax=Amanita muscaria (strain Koide BX008) TaxID=946122 RepID=A0A0C2WPK4_AMAMK|nr:hypothetical protein M378DRAFT_164246 [Amanita muscaria Koide BX008]
MILELFQFIVSLIPIDRSDSVQQYSHLESSCCACEEPLLFRRDSRNSSTSSDPLHKTSR